MVEGGVPFPLLSDAGGRIGTAYGVYEEAAGVDIRGRFLINPEGVILAMEVMTPEVWPQRQRAVPPGPGLPACRGHG
jgi:peroxiredoxin (alkyl hydroperoxide reductase subunit C)